MRSNTAVQPPVDLLDVAKVAAQINFEVEAGRLKRFSVLA